MEPLIEILMPSTAIIGLQYGDEGKGKIVDFLAKDFDYIVRFQGGNNAGHTVVINGDETILHLIPSGIFHNKFCVLGNGMVIDLDKLKEEIQMLERKGVNVLENLLISESAHLILPEDVESSKKDKTGGTGRGITPAYANKYMKEGLRIRDILNIKKPIEEVDLKARPKLSKFKDFLAQYSYLENNIVNVSKILNEAMGEGKNVLFEGAQGTGLDIDYGQYPFVTSSNATAGGICTGVGIGPTKINNVIGVCKAYTTRVDRDGDGPLTTQLESELEKKLRDYGNEYGATTGRPRRCGWFDVVLAKHAIRVNGASEIILTKLDVLDESEELKICTNYELDNKLIEDFPSDAIVQRRCRPVYKSMFGWYQSIKNYNVFDELPIKAKDYVKAIEGFLGVPVTMISIGPERNQIIKTN